MKWRITVDKESQEVLRIENEEDIRSQVSYHKQWPSPRDTQTTLIYKSSKVTGQQGEDGTRSDGSVMLACAFAGNCGRL